MMSLYVDRFLSFSVPSILFLFPILSDVVVQIVDARNPLLFRCPDLERYVKETDAKKQCVLLLNKADLLTPAQRWGKKGERKRLEGEEKMKEKIRERERKRDCPRKIYIYIYID